MIKDSNGRLDDYSISPKIRQILLHWGYELTESDFCDLFLNSQYSIFFLFALLKKLHYFFC